MTALSPSKGSVLNHSSKKNPVLEEIEPGTLPDKTPPYLRKFPASFVLTNGKKNGPCIAMKKGHLQIQSRI